jgi:Bifunctional DNA primase/polymerase, N-terminal
VPRGFKAATIRRDQALDWWQSHYARWGSNIGAPTGWPLADVLDVDQRRDGNGWAAYRQLKEAGLLAAAFALIRNRSGGAHVYLAGTRQRCGRLTDHWIDFKSQGGYVLLPPSFVHGEDGVFGAYEVAELRTPTGAVFDWEAARNLLCPPRPAQVRADGYRRGPGSAGHLVEWLEGECEGNRNNGAVLGLLPGAGGRGRVSDRRPCRCRTERWAG